MRRQHLLTNNDYVQFEFEMEIYKHLTKLIFDFLVDA